jgi:hypothetical protein
LSQIYLTQVYDITVQIDRSYFCDHFGILHVFFWHTMDLLWFFLRFYYLWISYLQQRLFTPGAALATVYDWYAQWPGRLPRGIDQSTSWLEGRPHRQRGRECWRWRYRTNGTAEIGVFEPRLHNNPNSAIAFTLWSSEHHRRWPTMAAHSGIRRKPATDHDSMLEYILKKQKLTLMQMGRSTGSLVVRGECMVHLSGEQPQKESGRISDDPQV